MLKYIYKNLEMQRGDKVEKAAKGSTTHRYKKWNVKDIGYFCLSILSSCLFWPDEIFILAPDIKRGQPVWMAIRVQKFINIDPELMIISGATDHLQSQDLVKRLTEGKHLIVKRLSKQ